MVGNLAIISHENLGLRKIPFILFIPVSLSTVFD
jgi:hypothetical protein